MNEQYKGKKADLCNGSNGESRKSLSNWRQWKKENAGLKRRLAESEAALHALISEQVDAVIDRATATPLLLQQTQNALLALGRAAKGQPGVGAAGVERTNELQRSQGQITDILNSIDDGFYALDKEWRFQYINQRAAQNVGYQPEDLVGQNIWRNPRPTAGTCWKRSAAE